MIGNLMQPNKTNYFFINEKIQTSSSSLFRKAFAMKILKSFIANCGDLFFNEGVPISVSIDIREIKRRNKYEREDGFTVGNPRIDNAVNIILEALVGAAFYSINQVVEVYVVKKVGNENRIKVELSRV